MIPRNPLQNKAYQKWPTFDAFKNSFKPGNLLMIYQDIQTIENSIAEKRLTLADIDYVYSDGKSRPGILYLEEWLKTLNAFCSVHSPLPPEIIPSVALMIFDDHKYLYLSDLKLVLDWLLKGKYGKISYSVETQCVLKAFSDYHQEKRYIINNLKSSIDNEYKKQCNEIVDRIKNEIYEELKSSGFQGNIFDEVKRLAPERIEAACNQAYKTILEQTIDKHLK